MLPIVLNNKMHWGLDFMRCTWHPEILFCTIQLVEFIGYFGMNRHLQEKKCHCTIFELKWFDLVSPDTLPCFASRAWLSWLCSWLWSSHHPNNTIHSCPRLLDSLQNQDLTQKTGLRNTAPIFEGLRNHTYPPWSIKNAWPKQQRTIWYLIFKITGLGPTTCCDLWPLSGPTTSPTGPLFQTWSGLIAQLKAWPWSQSCTTKLQQVTAFSALFSPALWHALTVLFLLESDPSMFPTPRRRLFCGYLQSQKRIEGNMHPLQTLSPFLSFWSAFVWSTCKTSRAIFGLAFLCHDVTKLLQIWYFRFLTVWLAKVVATAPEKSVTQRVRIQHPKNESTASQKLTTTKVSGNILQRAEKVLCLVLALSSRLMRL